MRALLRLADMKSAATVKVGSGALCVVFTQGTEDVSTWLFSFVSQVLTASVPSTLDWLSLIRNNKHLPCKATADNSQISIYLTRATADNSQSELFFHFMSRIGQKLRKKNEFAKSIKKKMKKSFLASECPQSVYIKFNVQCTVSSFDFTMLHGGILHVQHYVKSARHCKIGKAVTVCDNIFREGIKWVSESGCYLGRNTLYKLSCACDWNVSAFDSNFSQSPSSCLRLSRRSTRSWEKTNMN